MAEVLPQQRLLLELLIMSGDIAVGELNENSLLARTLGECKGYGWVKVSELCPGYFKTSITSVGRLVLDKHNRKQ